MCCAWPRWSGGTSTWGCSSRWSTCPRTSCSTCSTPPSRPASCGGRERAGALLVRARARAHDARAGAVGDAPRAPAPPHRRGDRGALRRAARPVAGRARRGISRAAGPEGGRARGRSTPCAPPSRPRAAWRTGRRSTCWRAPWRRANATSPSTKAGARSLLHDLALARWRLGRVDGARATFDRAAEAARRAGAAELFARAALGHSGGAWARYGTEDTASAHLLEEALALLPEADSPCAPRSWPGWAASCTSRRTPRRAARA